MIENVSLPFHILRQLPAVCADGLMMFMFGTVGAVSYEEVTTDACL